jgi:ABC-type sugar transport system ATPase subunit
MEASASEALYVEESSMANASPDAEATPTPQSALATPEQASLPEVLLSMEHISKTFPGVRALDDVDLEVHAGEVLALVGENGAGKSTLMKILTGALPKDAGTIRLGGSELTLHTPADALAQGISMIHQELALIPYLDAGQNIYLGREPERRLGVIDWPKLYDQARTQLEMVGIDVDPHTVVSELSIAQQQMVEIGKALSRQARLIVMDEATSSLTETETARLFELIRALKDRGVTVIYISHRIEEVFEIADRVTVLRDGHVVGTYAVDQVTPAQLVEKMVGRDIADLFQKQEAQRREAVLEVKQLASAGYLRDVSFELHGGEILGLAGLVGSGRTTLALTLFGVEKLQAGEIMVDGQPVTIDSPQAAIRHKIGLVPEDRKAQALFLNMSVAENIVISAFAKLSYLGLINFARVRRLAQQYVKQLGIRTPSLGQRTRNLSGGNQQKLVIARWLALNPAILILDEPTRGIDVGAKAEIHALMSQLAQQGMGILMISSELPEVLGVSDRILVMREGQLVAEFDREEATQEAIMSAATGTVDEGA